MPFDFIKKWYFDVALKKEVSVTEDNGASVGIYMQYLNDESHFDVLKTYIAHHGTKYEDIHFLSFANQKESVIAQQVYTLKDIKWYGIPECDLVSKFIARKYKRFYYLCPTMENHQLYVLSKIKADFKAGIYSKGVETLLDFTLDKKFSGPLESMREIDTTILKLRSK